MVCASCCSVGLFWRALSCSSGGLDMFVFRVCIGSKQCDQGDCALAVRHAGGQEEGLRATSGRAYHTPRVLAAHRYMRSAHTHRHMLIPRGHTCACCTATDPAVLCCAFLLLCCCRAQVLVVFLKIAAMQRPSRSCCRCCRCQESAGWGVGFLLPCAVAAAVPVCSTQGLSLNMLAA